MIEVLLPVFVVYVASAYLVLPSIWQYAHHQGKLDGLPMVTTTAQGLSADPINIGLVGSSRDILCAMRAAGWYAADPITWRSGLRISRSVIFHQPYPAAPVSHLFYAGRPEDFAFEKPAGGGDAHQRDHMRLWKVLDAGDERRPVWLGAATFDRSVGFSRYTGALTHHIARDVDTERSKVESDLERAGLIDARYQVTGIGPTLRGRNGEADPYETDGEVWMLRLVEGCLKRNSPPEVLPSPPVVAFKDTIWKNLEGLYRASQR